MNEKDIKDITKKSMIKASPEFTSRLKYRLEKEAAGNPPVRIPVGYAIIGGMAFIVLTCFVFLVVPEISISSSHLVNTIPKRVFQISMAMFFLLALNFTLHLKRQNHRIGSL